MRLLSKLCTAGCTRGAHSGDSRLKRRELPFSKACAVASRVVLATPVVPTSSAVCFFACYPPCPCAYWSSCLGGYSHCQSTAVPGAPLLQASGKSASGKPAAASLMHTMARLTSENWLSCHARSADVCGLREFYLLFSPAITDLFHPRRNPPANSAPDGNTRFAPGTLLLFEGTLSFPHLEPDGPTRSAARRGHRSVHRSLHGFTYSTQLVPLPERPLAADTQRCYRQLTQRCQVPMPCWTRANGHLRQMSAIPLPVLWACSHSLSTRRTASKLSKRIGAYGKMHTMLTKQPPGA